MNIPSSARTGVRNGLLTAVYIGLVVTFMQNATRLFGTQDIPYLTGFMALTLFVVSALITGSLVLWAPVRLMLEGNRREAAVMLVASGCTLVVFLIMIAAVTLAVR
jgi:hypothetical protein